MDNNLLIKKGLFLLIAAFLLLIWGCTEVKEPPKKSVKKKIIQTQSIPHSKTMKKSSPAKNRKAIDTRTRKAISTPREAVDIKKSKKIEKKPTKEIEKSVQTVVKEKTKVPYIYSPKGRPDPFRPFIVEVKVIPVKKGQRRIRLTPLERAALSQFKVVAILWSENESFAMVEDGTGKGYVIKIGTYIGKNGGKVIDIFQDHVVVEEPDIYGKKKANRIALKIRRGPGTGGLR